MRIYRHGRRCQFHVPVPFLKLRRSRAIHVQSISSNDIKNGITLEIDGAPWRVLEFLHVKPGKGAAFVRSKLKNLKTGTTQERTFRAGEPLEPASVSKKECQYTYNEGEIYVFMDMESYEEVRVPRDESWAGFLREGTDCSVLFHNGVVISVEPPLNLTLKIVQTDPGVKGNTSQGGTKPATLETGAVIQVPLFIEEGEEVKVDTRDAKYISRAT